MFSPYLFNFCQSTSTELVDVRNFPLKSVCRLFCTNQCEVPLALGYLAHIVRIISSALTSGVQSTISIVLQHTKSIFSLDYRGLLMLIPTYLQQIHTVLDPESGFSMKTRSAAVSILGSLVCIPDHYEKYEIPLVGKTEKMAMSSVKFTVYEEIARVLNKYGSARNEDKTYLRVINKCICCATVIVYQESARPSPDVSLLKVRMFLTIYNRNWWTRY